MQAASCVRRKCISTPAQSSGGPVASPATQRPILKRSWRDVLVAHHDPKTGEIDLHDIFVAGRWVGSRRTIPQCIDALRYHEWPSAVIGGEFQINHEHIFFTEPMAGASRV